MALLTQEGNFMFGKLERVSYFIILICFKVSLKITSICSEDHIIKMQWKRKIEIHCKDGINNQKVYFPLKSALFLS